MVAVRKAEFAGACYGVQRALDMARDAAREGGTVQSLGPLIHNPVVVAKLQESGVQVADSIADITADRVIVRSHGVGPQVRRALDESSAQVVDATCPHVYRAQRAAAELARECGTVIVVGDAKHPEVEGLRAYAEQAGGNVVVAASAEDLPEGLPDVVGVVVQTTQSRQLFDSVLKELSERGVQARHHLQRHHEAPEGGGRAGGPGGRHRGHRRPQLLEHHAPVRNLSRAVPEDRPHRDVGRARSGILRGLRDRGRHGGGQHAREPDHASRGTPATTVALPMPRKRAW